MCVPQRPIGRRWSKGSDRCRPRDRSAPGREFSFQFFRLLRQRDGVQVDDAEKVFVLVLQFDPVDQRAEIISDMQIAGGCIPLKMRFFIN